MEDKLKKLAAILKNRKPSLSNSVDKGFFKGPPASSYDKRFYKDAPDPSNDKKFDSEYKEDPIGREPASYKPVGQDRFESLTGTPYINTNQQKKDIQKQYDEEKDLKKKKRIKQIAHFSGHSLDD
jgi:hypothetical protein